MNLSIRLKHIYLHIIVDILNSIDEETEEILKLPKGYELQWMLGQNKTGRPEASVALCKMVKAVNLRSVHPIKQRKVSTNITPFYPFYLGADGITLLSKKNRKNARAPHMVERGKEITLVSQELYEYFQKFLKKKRKSLY